MCRVPPVFRSLCRLCLAVCDDARDDEADVDVEKSSENRGGGAASPPAARFARFALRPGSRSGCDRWRRHIEECLSLRVSHAKDSQIVVTDKASRRGR